MRKLYIAVDTTQHFNLTVIARDKLGRTVRIGCGERGEVLERVAFVAHDAGDVYPLKPSIEQSADGRLVALCKRLGQRVVGRKGFAALGRHRFAL